MAGARMASGIPFSQDVFFGPNTIHAMVTAFDKACRSLHDAGQPGIARDRLCEATLKALGFDRSADR